MDIQLQELLTKIKEDGMLRASEETAKLVAAAEEKAAQIVAEAEKKAAALLSKTREKTLQSEASSKQALKNASRDILLSLSQQLKNIVDTFLSSEVKKTISQDQLRSLIIDIVTEYSKNKKDIEVIFPAKTQKKFIDLVKQGLKGKTSVEIMATKNPELPGGFQIRYKNDDVVLDYSFEAIKEKLAALVNPALQEIVKGS